MKVSFTPAIFVAILSSVLCRPVRRKEPATQNIESLLAVNWGLISFTRGSPDVLELFNLSTLNNRAMIMEAVSICEFLDYFKHSDNPTPIGPTYSSCLNSTETDSVLPLIVHMFRTRTCTWLHNLGGKVLPNCRSHAYDVDLFCHNVRLHSISQKLHLALA